MKENIVDLWWDEKSITRKVESERDGEVTTAYQIKVFSYKDIIDLKERLGIKDKLNEKKVWRLCELHKNGDPDYPKEQCGECTFALVLEGEA